MACFTIPDVRLTGLAASVPAHVEENGKLELLPQGERDFFIKNTGIAKRRIAKDGITTVDLCVAAAKRLIDKSGIESSDISTLIFVTQSPDYKVPASACIMQERLKLDKTTVAMDLNLGCSGYVYGLSTISSLIANMPGKYGLLLVGDVSSFYVSDQDKSTKPLFGDAGSATLVKHEPGNQMHFNLQTDGSGFDAIIVPDGGMKNPVNTGSLEMKQSADGIERRGLDLHLNGIDVFQFSMKEVAPNVEALLAYSGSGIEDVDHFIFHQANRILNDGIIRKLGIDPSKAPSSLANFGNTSSATIPVTMISEISESLSSGRSTLVLSGFGVGLSWGSALIQVDALICPPIVEL